MESTTKTTDPHSGAPAGVCPVAHDAVSKTGVNPEIPGPAPTPILGWRGNIIRYFRDPLGVMQRLRQSFGDVVCLAKGGNAPLILKSTGGKSSTVFAFGAERNREILTQPDLFERDFVKAPEQCPWLCDNMSAANRENRTTQRQVIKPAFTAQHLKKYHPHIVELTEEMLSSWQPGQRLELTEAVEDLCAAIASQTFYGQDLRREPKTLAAIARDVGSALFSPVSKIPIDLPGSPYRKFLNLVKTAETRVLDEVARRRREEDQGDDVLSMMLEAISEGNVSLNDNQLVGNAFTLFLAGHDVPANAIGLTLLLLLQHPQVMADLHDELTGTLEGQPPTYEQLWQFPLLDRVVKESLRLLSPAVLIWRRVHEEAALGPYMLPAGTEVMVSPYMVHIDPDVYSDAKRFQPERWERFRPSPFEYLPFSYGARKCLGAAFAEMMLRIIIPMIVQRYRLELTPREKVDLFVTFTMKPKSGLHVTVRDQDRQFERSRVELRGQIRDLVDFPESSSLTT